MDENRKSRFTWPHAIAFLVAIVIYPFSMGPAFYVFALLGQPEKMKTVLGCIYFPLIFWLPEPLDNALTKYIEWWCTLGGMSL